MPDLSKHWMCVSQLFIAIFLAQKSHNNTKIANAHFPISFAFNLVFSKI